MRIISTRRFYMMTDVSFWVEQFDLLSKGQRSGMKKAMMIQTSYLEKLKQKGLQGKDETMFYKQLFCMNATLSEHLDKLAHSVAEHAKTEQRLRRFKDDCFDYTEELDELYRMARGSLQKQTNVVERQRKKYHEIAFCVETVEIRATLADGSKELSKTRKKLDVLQKKMEARLAKYSKEVGKWKFLASRVLMMSDEYERAYVSREAARANIVLTCLQDLVEKTITREITKRAPNFTAIIEPRFAREHLIERETVQTQTLQAYVGEKGTGEMYERATSWLKDSSDTCRNNSSKPAESGLGSCDIEGRFAINKKLSELTTVFEVTREYHKQHTNQLTLKPGDVVKQILPENEHGFAYGQLTHGMFKKKQEGFFPVSHVFLIRGFREIRRD